MAWDLCVCETSLQCPPLRTVLRRATHPLSGGWGQILVSTLCSLARRHHTSPSYHAVSPFLRASRDHGRCSAFVSQIPELLPPRPLVLHASRLAGLSERGRQMSGRPRSTLARLTRRRMSRVPRLPLLMLAPRMAMRMMLSC